MKNVDIITFDAALKQINEKMKLDNKNLILSGFNRLNEIKQGWFNGELCVIGGRPSMGKTGFILSVISYILNKNIPVSLFTATDKLNERFLTRIITNLNLEGQDDKEQSKLLSAIDLTHIPLFLNSQHNMTIEYIKVNSSILVNNYGIKCIFIEDLQSIFYSEINGVTKEGMEYVCHELKKLARDLNVPIIVTSDLNRTVERREGVSEKEPILSDLYGSSAIENVADSVILLHRPEYYRIYQDEKGNDLRNIIEIKIKKNRNRHIGDVIYKFNHNIGRVEEFGDIILE